MGSSEAEEGIADILLEMGGVLLNEQTVGDVLDIVTELAERTVRSACAVSVTLERRGSAYTPTASEAIARELDEVQYETGRGPCLEALSSQGIVNASLIATDGRWPEFTEAAGAGGVASILSVPLVAGESAIGALNVYSSDDAEFSTQETATASLLARQAAVVLANATAFADASALTGQLVEALATRDLIGQAKGILMARESCDADAAFDILRRASQRSNRKLRDVALDVVASVKRSASAAQ